MNLEISNTTHILKVKPLSNWYYRMQKAYLISEKITLCLFNILYMYIVESLIHK